MEPEVQKQSNEEEAKILHALVEKSTLQSQWEIENKTNNENKEMENTIEKKNSETPILTHPDNGILSSLDSHHPKEPIGAVENVSNKRKVLDQVDKSKFMYNKANNSRENSTDKIEKSKKTTEKIQRNKSITSLSSNESKKITLRRFWWDKSDSNLRLPLFQSPRKDVSSKIGSLEKINHKPDGGNIQLIDIKPNWKKEARTQHGWGGVYKPGGGNVQILNRKLEWNVKPKIGSLDNAHHVPAGGNIEIINMPFDKTGIKPKTDTGFIYEELIVPIDYVINTPRNPLTPLSNSSNNSSVASSQLGKNFYKLEPIRESDFNKKKSENNRY